VPDQQSVGRSRHGSSGLVLHVGSHKGAGFEEVVAQIARAFERALDDAEPAPRASRTARS